MIYWQTSDSKTKSSPSPGVVAAQIQSHSPAPRRCLSIQKPPGTLPGCQTHQPGNFMDHPFHLNKNIVIQCSYKDSQLIISHFQTITSKNLQKNISFFFWKHFSGGNLQRRVLGKLLCLGHVLAGDAHALRPAAWAEARLLQALRHLAMRREVDVERCEKSHVSWHATLQWASLSRIFNSCASEKRSAVTASRICCPRFCSSWQKITKQRSVWNVPQETWKHRSRLEVFPHIQSRQNVVVHFVYHVCLTFSMASFFKHFQPNETAKKETGTPSKGPEDPGSRGSVTWNSSKIQIKHQKNWFNEKKGIAE